MGSFPEKADSYSDAALGVITQGLTMPAGASTKLRTLDEVHKEISAAQDRQSAELLKRQREMAGMLPAPNGNGFEFGGSGWAEGVLPGGPLGEPALSEKPLWDFIDTNRFFVPSEFTYLDEDSLLVNVVIVNRTTHADLTITAVEIQGLLDNLTYCVPETTSGQRTIPAMSTVAAMSHLPIDRVGPVAGAIGLSGNFVPTGPFSHISDLPQMTPAGTVSIESPAPVDGSVQVTFAWDGSKPTVSRRDAGRSFGSVHAHAEGFGGFFTSTLSSPLIGGGTLGHYAVAMYTVLVHFDDAAHGLRHDG